MNTTKYIQLLFGLLFAIISISSFALSFMNLTDAAIEAGFPSDWARLWPLGIDTFIVMGSIFILQASIQKESANEGWAVVGIFTFISIVFNIVHSPGDPTSQAAHGVPPVALCWSLHLLMVRLKRDLLRTPEVLGSVESTQDPSFNIDPEKAEKVKNWFTVNPGGKTEEARKALRMSWTTVQYYRDYLNQKGELPERRSFGE